MLRPAVQFIVRNALIAERDSHLVRMLFHPGGKKLMNGQMLRILTCSLVEAVKQPVRLLVIGQMNPADLLRGVFQNLQKDGAEISDQAHDRFSLE
ncbi:hypothetical protein D3C75_879740 [compost metagenome]